MCGGIPVVTRTRCLVRRRVVVLQDANKLVNQWSRLALPRERMGTSDRGTGCPGQVDMVKSTERRGLRRGRVWPPEAISRFGGRSRQPIGRQPRR